MIPIRLFFTFILMIFCQQLFAQQSDDQHFSDGCLRYDFELIGDSDTTFVVFIQKKQLKEWGGNPENLIERGDLGTFRANLFDIKTGDLLFQHRFCTLFMEWKTTTEAKNQMGSYYQSVFFPMPKLDVLLTLQQRNRKNEWVTIHSDTIKTSDYFIINESPSTFKSEKIVSSGDCSEKIDLVILSEGYTVDEMGKFSTDAKRLTDSLFSSTPFNRYKTRFNITAIQVPSLESGTDIPGQNLYKNTFFNSHFYTFNSARYLTTSDMKTIYDVLDGFCHDQIYILVNTEHYGGGGFYNFLNLCTSDNEQSPFVFIHEFGHGFAGLGDEYYTPETTYEEYYSIDVEPWEPNLTTLVNFGNKWEKQLDNSTPVPTPRDSIYSNSTGVFEGGGYVEKGVFSPMMTCWMKERKANGFCPVCIKAIENAILYQTR